jgi:hypothetical protein
MDAMMYSVFVWVPRFRGGGEVPSIEGMERSFWSMEKKRGGDREAAGDDFIPYMTIFLLLGMG